MMGIAVFHDDKLVGELNAQETLCHLLLRNEIESCNITIPYPGVADENIDLYLYNHANPKVKVDIINGSPFIKIQLKLEARILSINNNSNYDTEKKLSEITLAANQYIQNMMTDYLYKTSTKLKSDIDGFGKYILSKFLTQSDFENYNWLDNYKDSVFEVHVDTNVKSAFLLGGDE